MCRRALTTRAGSSPALLVAFAVLVTAFVAASFVNSADARTIKPFKATSAGDLYHVGDVKHGASGRLVGYKNHAVKVKALKRHLRHGVLGVAPSGRVVSPKNVAKGHARKHRDGRHLVVARAAAVYDTQITSGPAQGSTTTSRSATFRFSYLNAQSFRCSIDGRQWYLCTSPKTYTNLSLGKHYVRVQARSGSGRLDDTPARRDWTIVASNPTPPPTTPPTTDPTPPPPPSSDSCKAPYSATSPWNTPVGSSPTVDPRNAQFISSMDPSTAKLTSDPTQYTLPVYYATNATPKANVTYAEGFFSDVTNNGQTLTNYRPANAAQRVTQMPIPSGLAAAAGSDAQIIIINTDTGEEWGASHFTKTSTGYSAWNIGHYNIAWSGVPPYDANGNPYWNRGPRIPYLTGLVRPCEIAQGHIDHALAVGLPKTSPEFVYPATGSDGQSPASTGIPEGTRLQLDPTVSDDTIRNTWNCTGACFTVAKAAQKYGMYVADTAGRAKVYFEYEATAKWNGAITAGTVSPIPLSKFRAVRPPAH
jgi:hypothetical protein